MNIHQSQHVPSTGNQPRKTNPCLCTLLMGRALLRLGSEQRPKASLHLIFCVLKEAGGPQRIRSVGGLNSRDSACSGWTLGKKRRGSLKLYRSKHTICKRWQLSFFPLLSLSLSLFSSGMWSWYFWCEKQGSMKYSLYPHPCRAKAQRPHLWR